MNSKCEIDRDGTKHWFNEHKQWHRLDGPAVERADGAKEWWVNGKQHRLDGPAYISADGTKAWWMNDKLHRLDGPAVERADGAKEWWVDENQIEEQNFLQAVIQYLLNIDEQIVEIILKELSLACVKNQ